MCYCGNDLKFLDYRRGFRQYCSKKCTANSDAVADKTEQTIKDRYGESHYSKTSEYKVKFKKTCQDRYGVDNPGQITNLKTVRSRQKQKTFIDELIVKISDTTKPLFDFDEYTHVRDDSLMWECTRCGAVFQSSLFGKMPMCATCFPRPRCGGQSSVEKDMLSSIREFYDGEIVENSRKIITPKELDLFFPDLNFAIEVNGVYWHSDLHLDKMYHYEKFKLCSDQDIDLFMISDHDWVTNKELVLRMIKHRLGIATETVYARNCTIKYVDSKTARSFFDKNHISGFAKASQYYGLFSDSELVSCVAISDRHRFQKNSKAVEIVRLAFGAYSVPGALGKLLKVIKSDYPECDIVSYADLRYGSGKVYEKNGFTLSHSTQPGYWYYLNGRVYHRLSWTKKKLVKLGYDPALTEREIMCNIGACRVYDAGHNYYIWRA